ncbi:MAG: PEP-CTERM sorting domain-containing protein [Isosphaeraceae bacterium]|nr:PEP-CTERM sorting domain-containing protein [Isosphaeraceae bacterium]
MRSILARISIFSAMILASAAPAHAGLLMYLDADKPDFVAALDPGYFAIDEVGPPGAFGTPLTYSQGPGRFGISISANNYAIYRHNNIIHTFGIYDTLTIRFDRSTSAFGAGFGSTTDGGALTGNYAYIFAKSKSGAVLDRYARLGEFVGFIATPGDELDYVQVIKADGDLGRYSAIVPRIYVGTAFSVPEPSTLALAGIGAVVATARFARRNRAV